MNNGQKDKRLGFVPNQVLRIRLVSVVNHKLSVKKAPAISHHAVVHFLVVYADLSGTDFAWWSFETGCVCLCHKNVPETHSYQEHWKTLLVVTDCKF